MPTSEWLRQSGEALTSTKTALRLMSAGCGILIFSLGLYRIVRSWAPADDAPYIRTAFACFGFAAGIGFFELCRLLFSARVAERVTSQSASSKSAAEGRSVGASAPVTRAGGGHQPAASLKEYPPTNRGLHGAAESNKAHTPVPQVFPEAGGTAGRRSGLRRVLIAAMLVVVASASLWGAKRLIWPVNEVVQHSGPDEISAPTPTPDEKLENAIQAKPEGLRKSLREYAKISEDVALILRDGLEAQNIGGAVAVAVTNWQFNHVKGVYRRPEELGLLRIRDAKAVVNRAIKGDAIIESVAVTPQPGRAFKVVITVFN